MRFFLLLPLFFSTSLFALISIAPVDIGSNPGFSGNVSGSLGSKSGNTNKDDYSLGLRLQYDEGEDYLVWGTVTYNYGESEGIKNEDRTYVHLRTVHALYEKEWCGELFIQSEQDEFKDIHERSLAGANVRWRFFNSDNLVKGYAGLGVLAEKIDYSHPLVNPHENNTRLNSYIAYTRSFMVTSKASYVGYYQPKLGDSSDYITAHDLELIVPIYEKLYLSMNAKYTYDSRPPLGVEKQDTMYKSALSWEF